MLFISYYNKIQTITTIFTSKAKYPTLMVIAPYKWQVTGKHI